ncbi:MAG: hypothetical protein AB2551_20210 [Candidatus Thiodiazotropha sp.]
MQLIYRVSAILGLLISFQQTAFSCEKYESFTLDEQKSFREMLNKSNADPLDRLFAFNQLACSDDPNIRSYAIREGLKNSSDELVRNQVMLTAFMQMKRVDIELGESDGATKDDQSFIKKNSGIFSKNVQYKSKTDGCISLYRTDKCLSNSSLFIKGDKVEYNYKSIFGEFRLTSNNEMLGFLRVANTRKYSRIPAVIKLF